MSVQNVTAGRGKLTGLSHKMWTMIYYCVFYELKRKMSQLEKSVLCFSGLSSYFSVHGFIMLALVVLGGPGLQYYRSCWKQTTS